jgi:hypothetical protein
VAEPLDLKVVGRGAAVQIALVVPPAMLVSALRQDDMGAESNLWLVAAFLALVVGPAVVGVLVGRWRPEAPMLHAAVATGAAWAVVAVVSIVRATVAGHDLAPLVASLLSIAPIQVGIGVLGAFFSRPRTRPEGTDPVHLVNPAAAQPDAQGEVGP